MDVESMHQHTSGWGSSIMPRMTMHSTDSDSSTAYSNMQREKFQLIHLETVMQCDCQLCTELSPWPRRIPRGATFPAPNSFILLLLMLWYHPIFMRNQPPSFIFPNYFWELGFARRLLCTPRQPCVGS